MRYLLTTEQMVENDYPLPSYVADVFQKPPGWVETPAQNADLESDTKPPRIYAIDCEMVCRIVMMFNRKWDIDEMISA